MTDVKAVFGSLRDYQKGRIEIINDDPKNYVFSNVFEVAGKSRPYERIAVGKKFEYVIECLRAERTSPWYTCAHDEFALVMDGKVEIWLVKLDDQRLVPAEKTGAVLIAGEPMGRLMGTIIPVNCQFADVPQDQPVIKAQPGFEGQVCAFNLFGYLSRSDVTWNPSVCSVVKESLYCPTSKEFILPVEHGNDRVEWFLQMSDEITWVVKDKMTGAPRATRDRGEI